jgi:hypothetical protein
VQPTSTSANRTPGLRRQYVLAPGLVFPTPGTLPSVSTQPAYRIPFALFLVASNHGGDVSRVTPSNVFACVNAAAPITCCYFNRCRRHLESLLIPDLGHYVDFTVEGGSKCFCDSCLKPQHRVGVRGGKPYVKPAGWVTRWGGGMRMPALSISTPCLTLCSLCSLCILSSPWVVVGHHSCVQQALASSLLPCCLAALLPCCLAALLPCCLAALLPRCLPP